MLIENQEPQATEPSHQQTVNEPKETRKMKFNKTKAIHKTRPEKSEQNTKPRKKVNVGAKEVLEIDSTETSNPQEYTNESSFRVFAQQFAEDKLIPEEYLGDVLEIYTFFQYFDPILDGPIFEMEELWACFYYQGDKFLDLIQDIHLVLINLWVKSLFHSRQLFDNYQTDKGHSLFLMIYNIYFKEKFRTLTVRAIWPALMKELIEVYPSYCSNHKELTTLLSVTDINNYNRLSVHHKIELLLFLTKVSGELQVFKNEHQNKSDKVQELTKKKVEVFNKLKDVRNEYMDVTKRMSDIDDDIGELETEQNNKLGYLSRDEAHNLLSQINSKRREKGKVTKDYNRLETAKTKLEKELRIIKREIPMCVHLSNLLGIDYEGNSYWVFRFDNTRMYKCDKSQYWKVSQGSFDEILSVLDTQDEEQNTIRSKVQHYMELELLDRNATDSANAKTDDDVTTINDYIVEIFDYKSTYDTKEKRVLKKRGGNKLVDEKFEAFFELMKAHPIAHYIEYEFIRKLVFFLESEVSAFLELKDAHWVEPEARQKDFIDKVNNMNSVLDIRAILEMMDKHWCAITIRYIEEESEAEEPEKETRQIVLEEADEEEEIVFRRKKTGKDMEIEKEREPVQKFATKTATLKFWNYYMYKSKIMWRDFITKVNTTTDGFFAVMVFGTNLLRFIANKTEKLMEEQQREEEQKQREMEEGKIKEQYAFKGTEIHARYNLRKNRQIPKKKEVYCVECMERLGTECVKCYACGQAFHYECLGLNRNGNYSQWRCENCLDKIANKRLTRSMRRQLKYYD